MAEPLQVSNSALRTFQRCRRQWWLSTYLGYDSDPATRAPVGVAQLGTTVHLALQAWYGYDLDPVAVLHYLYDQLVAARPEAVNELEKERGYAVTMTKGYVEWAQDEGVDVDHEVLAVEHELRVPLTLDDGRQLVLRGKLDQLTRRLSDGRLLVRDFKTGDLSKVKGLVRDQQMRFYALMLALQLKGTDQHVAGALYTTLKRSKRTTRATPPFYAQTHIEYNRHDLNSAYLRVFEVTREMLEVITALELGADPRALAYPNPTDYCDWGCPFVNVCHLFDDGSRALAAVEANYVKRDPWDYYKRDRIDEVLTAFGRSPETRSE